MNGKSIRMVQVSTQITQQEFIRFNFSHFFSRLFVRLFLAITGLISLFCLIGFFMMILTDYEQASPFEMLKPLLIFSGILALSCWSVYAQSKRSYKTTNSVHEPIVYTFSEGGIHIKGKSFETELQWPIVYQVKETKRLFLLYQNSLAANIVPKNAFSSKEEISALRKLIAAQPNMKHKLRRD